MMISAMTARLETLSDRPTSAILQRFFKTGPGEYGEGDCFRGIRVPVLRKLCREFREANIDDIMLLLVSSWHEDRLFALLLLVELYGKADEAGRERIYSTYCSRTDRINNWDLVDLSAPNIVGRHLVDRDRSPLYRFAVSENLWERRIAIVSTFTFIRKEEFADTFAIAEQLLEDRHDLIHKAAGWMLREVGKRDQSALVGFLAGHYRRMSRTMLRYAIERFPEELRQQYLKGEITY